MEFHCDRGAPIELVAVAVEKAGWPVVWSGGEGYGVRFAYVEPPDAPAAVIEISELTDATGGQRDVQA